MEVSITVDTILSVDQTTSIGTLHLPFEEEKCTIQFIKNIFYYAAISNWVAYSVQYHVAIELKDLLKIDFKRSIPKADTLKNLIKELRHFTK